MKKHLILWCLICLLSLAGCSPPPTTEEFFAMDTVMRITLYNSQDQTLLQEAKEQVLALESLFSVTKPQSEIYKANQAQGSTTTVSPHTTQLLQTAIQFSKETGGLFDCTVYPAVKAWGFTQTQNRVPTNEELQNLIPLMGSEKIHLENNTLTLPQGVQVDLGGIAKGYAADETAKWLKEQNCQGAILSFGGNVKTIGNKPDDSLFQVAVQDPNDATRTVGTLSVGGETAVVTSGDTQRYFEQEGKRYHHIIDPRTGSPAQSDLTAVTVVCSSATKADAFATALYIMGLEEAVKWVENKQGIEALLITKDKEIHLTTGLKENFSPLETTDYIVH